MVTRKSFPWVLLRVPLGHCKPMARITYSATAAFISLGLGVWSARAGQFFAKPEESMSTETTRDGYVQHLEAALNCCLEAQIEIARAKHHVEKPHKARLLPAERRVSQLEDCLRRSLTGILEARKVRESQL